MKEDKEFHLGAFMKLMENASSLHEDEIDAHERTLRTIRTILDNDVATPELLDSVTLQDIEWAFDAILYWPSWEMEVEEHDLDHVCVQHMQIRDMVSMLSKQKSIKRKVTFI